MGVHAVAIPLCGVAADTVRWWIGDAAQRSQYPSHRGRRRTLGQSCRQAGRVSTLDPTRRLRRRQLPGTPASPPGRGRSHQSPA